MGGFLSMATTAIGDEWSGVGFICINNTRFIYRLFLMFFFALPQRDDEGSARTGWSGLSLFETGWGFYLGWAWGDWVYYYPSFVPEDM